MDVFCVGMYRSGSTWQYEVACHLVEQYHAGRRLGFVPGEQYAAGGSGWRVLKAHDAHPRFTAALASGRARALYSYRDLRDVAYSLMHKFAASFEEIVHRKKMLHACLANDAIWTGQRHTLCQCYEEILSDPSAAVEAIAQHLDVSLADGEADAVAQEYSLSANQRRAEELALSLRAQGVDLDQPVNALRWDQHTLLHWNHIRDGRIGGWREQASGQEVRALQKIAGPWLAAHGYDD
jgi:hypothetical protein